MLHKLCSKLHTEVSDMPFKVSDSFAEENGKYYIAHSAECDESYYNQDFTDPYILISGSSSPLIGRNPSEAVNSYCNLVKKVKSMYKE